MIGLHPLGIQRARRKTDKLNLSVRFATFRDLTSFPMRGRLVKWCTSESITIEHEGTLFTCDEVIEV